MLDKEPNAGIARLAVYSKSKRDVCGNAVGTSRNVLFWGKSPGERDSPTSPNSCGKMFQNPDGNNSRWVPSVSTAEGPAQPGRCAEVSASLKEHADSGSLFGAAALLRMEKQRSRGRTSAAAALHAPEPPQAEPLLAHSPAELPSLPVLQRFHCHPKNGGNPSSTLKPEPQRTCAVTRGHSAGSPYPCRHRQRAASPLQRPRTCLRPRGSVPTVLARCWILLLSIGTAGSPAAAPAPKPTKLALWFCWMSLLRAMSVQGRSTRHCSTLPQR